MIFEVVTELKAFLEETLSELYQGRPDGESATPKVCIGALPAKSEDDDFPFVMVRPVAGSCGDDQTLVDVILVFGAYNPAEDYGQGYLDLVNMITRTWIRLSSVGYLGGRFELLKPLTWRIGGEDQNQPVPHYIGSMNCKFQIPAVLLDHETAVDVEVFGNGCGID